MVHVLNIFSYLYPASFLILLTLLAVSFVFSRKMKKSRILNILILISISVYLVSFFSNYETEFFLIAWFLRDMIILVLLFTLWKLLVKYKVASIIIVSVLLIGVGFLYFKTGLPGMFEKDRSFSEFDNSAELLFDIKKHEKLPKIKSLLKEFNLEIKKAFPHIEDTSVTELDDYYTIDTNNKDDLYKITKKLVLSGLVDWVEFNDVYKLSPIEIYTKNSDPSPTFTSKILNDPDVTKLWGFKYMEIDDLNELLKSKKPVRKANIFILDTGVDSDHEDLQTNYVSLNKRYDKDTGLHGTHCAGIACAVSNNGLGIASLNLTGKYTTITSITVLPGGNGTQESVIDGIILAADNDADVISMSLGGRTSEKRQRAYNEAIKYANEKGAIVVVAAGNESSNAIDHVPAACSGVITVSAVDEDLQIADFSNYVSDIDFKVAAPGVNIYSTIPFNEYKSMNGTSMATPYVAGLIGIMKSINPELTTEEVYRILNTTGIDTKNTDKTGKFIQPLKVIEKLKSKPVRSFFNRFVNKLLTVKP